MTQRRTTVHTLEIDRISALPISNPLTEEEVIEFSRQELKAAAFDEGFRFWWTQAQAVLDYDLMGGGLHPVGVGWGKTYISLMILMRMYRKGLQRLIHFVPSQVYAQLVRTDIPRARSKIDLSIPFHYIGSAPPAERKRLAKSGKKGCYILTYSSLSNKDAAELLELIDPDGCVSDEAHNFKNRDSSARVKRFMHHVEERIDSGRMAEYVFLSGTMTKKSVRDYHHLSTLALREGSPLPLSKPLADQWAMVLDAEAKPSDANLGPIRPLIDWAEDHFPEIELPPGVAGFREAYRLRLTSTPGVVSTGDAEIGTSLTLCNTPVEHDYKSTPAWTELQAKIGDVENLWLSPSGDEIQYGMQLWRFLWELNSGFYYKLVWPTAGELAERKHMTLDEAQSLLMLAQTHHAKHQVYSKELRDWLKTYYMPNIDSPMLVGKHLNQHGTQGLRGAEMLYDAWQQMKAAEYPNMPERESHAVRICDFKIRSAVEWCHRLLTEKPGTGALLWVFHQEIGQWLYEVLYQHGYDVLHCPAGSAANVAITDPANARKLVVASLTAHSTGKNLQHFTEQRYVQWPRDAALAEQSLGRTHRNGQLADDLFVATCNSTAFDDQNFSACLIDALYLHQTLGSRQKVIYANYDPMPKIYPADFLRERGFANRLLTKTEQVALEEKFGPALAP